MFKWTDGTKEIYWIGILALEKANGTGDLTLIYVNQLTKTTSQQFVFEDITTASSFGSSLTVNGNLNVYQDINSGYVGLYNGGVAYILVV